MACCFNVLADKPETDPLSLSLDYICIKTQGNFRVQESDCQSAAVAFSQRDVFINQHRGALEGNIREFPGVLVSRAVNFSAYCKGNPLKIPSFIHACMFIIFGAVLDN